MHPRVFLYITQLILILVQGYCQNYSRDSPEGCDVSGRALPIGDKHAQPSKADKYSYQRYYLRILLVLPVPSGSQTRAISHDAVLRHPPLSKRGDYRGCVSKTCLGMPLAPRHSQRKRLPSACCRTRLGCGADSCPTKSRLVQYREHQGTGGRHLA